MDGSRLRGLTARTALRQATGAIHERLHRAPPFLSLSHGQLSLSGYAALLSRLATFYLNVARHLPIDPARLALLKMDLAAVSAPNPQQLTWTAPVGEAERLGWRYVVDGSIFGGRVIHRQLDYLLGEEERGRRFFRGSPCAAGKWQQLCGELERVGTDERRLERMVAGAMAAFATFEDLLAREEPVYV